jgi:hypothetical protein
MTSGKISQHDKTAVYSNQPMYCRHYLLPSANESQRTLATRQRTATTAYITSMMLCFTGKKCHRVKDECFEMLPCIREVLNSILSPEIGYSEWCVRDLLSSSTKKCWYNRPRPFPVQPQLSYIRCNIIYAENIVT